MKDFGRQSTFASFLPGIAGKTGIPIWCFYVNRGQGVVSFGIENKDHAIMEFYPAHVAYQNVKRTGFRTFVKVNGQVYEPFSDEKLAQDMDIRMNLLMLTENDPKSGCKTEISYAVLPEENVGALLRKVVITNTSDHAMDMEVLDGMPAVVPYGVGMDSLKNMTQTAKAWMQAQVAERQIACFKVRASMADSANVDQVLGMNFSTGVDADGNHLDVIVDPEVVFGYDLSLARAVNLMDEGIDALLARRQNHSNIYPCSFFVKKAHVNPGEEVTLYELYGQAQSQEVLDQFLQQDLQAAYFERKLDRAVELTDELTDCIDTKTGNQDFDDYCRYTYMDNVLRGGKPVLLGDHNLFYLYSRKHGDLERDYNEFSMSPEYFTQGNGNFRDVNQNRRCDTFFSPFVGTDNIHTFYSLVQLDGYNPLKLEAMSYRIDAEKFSTVTISESVREDEKLGEMLSKPFTPGKLYAALKNLTESEEELEENFAQIMNASIKQLNASFGEGYWSDHWDYNLDLIEDYLAIYPEREEALYFADNYLFFQSPEGILPRKKRYVNTSKGVRQYNYLQPVNVDTIAGFVADPLKKEEQLKTTLIEKMLLLCTLKFAALDEQNMGVEMEGGKPGWYDALNGLPGMLGSSMAETYELLRTLETLVKIVKRYPKKVKLLAELGDLLDELKDTCETFLVEKNLLVFWNQRNDAKEAYRAKVYAGISGNRKEYDSTYLLDLLENFVMITSEGIARAKTYSSETVPTYFYYEVTDFTEDENGLTPLAFAVHPVADFLEGPVRYLKLSVSMEEKRELYQKVKRSDLYDDVLKMYKVNASLANESFELGRTTAFTPGWLENGSIWLHMEYKYLLELLKSGLYQEFGEDFYAAGIPFQDEKRYGRSILENSSFLASSSNPNPDIWGKGFVARLSGSTIEFIHMWRIMMFGLTPFYQENGELKAKFSPAIPEYLVGDDKSIQAMFLSNTKVTYHFSEQKAYYPGEYIISKMTLTRADGSKMEIEGDTIGSKDAQALRDGEVRTIEISVV